MIWTLPLMETVALQGPFVGDGLVQGSTGTYNIKMKGGLEVPSQ